MEIEYALDNAECRWLTGLSLPEYEAQQSSRRKRKLVDKLLMFFSLKNNIKRDINSLPAFQFPDWAIGDDMMETYKKVIIRECLRKLTLNTAPKDAS